jgi:hypothetical protein
MRLEGCARESELKQALESGQWPLACTGELRAHVEGCPSCKEQVALSSAFRQARGASMAAAHMGSPGLIWWRAQLRRRNQAVERITRPLLGAQVFALAVMLLAALGWIGYRLSQQADPIGMLKRLPEWFSVRLATLSAAGVADAGTGWLLPMVLLSAIVLLGSVVVYFSSDRN